MPTGRRPRDQIRPSRCQYLRSAHAGAAALRWSAVGCRTQAADARSPRTAGSPSGRQHERAHHRLAVTKRIRRVIRRVDNGGLWKRRTRRDLAPLLRKAVHSIGAVTLDKRNQTTVWVGTARPQSPESGGEAASTSREAAALENVGLRQAGTSKWAVDPSNSDVGYSPRPVGGDGEERGSQVNRRRRNGHCAGRDEDREPRRYDDPASQRVMPPVSGAGSPSDSWGRSGAALQVVDGGPLERLSTGLPEADGRSRSRSNARTNARDVSVEQPAHTRDHSANGRGTLCSDDGGIWVHERLESSPATNPDALTRANRLHYMVRGRYHRRGKTSRARQSLHGDDRVLIDLTLRTHQGRRRARDIVRSRRQVARLPTSRQQFYRLSVSTQALSRGRRPADTRWCGPTRPTHWGRLTTTVQRGGGDGF